MKIVKDVYKHGQSWLMTKCPEVYDILIHDTKTGKDSMMQLNECKEVFGVVEYKGLTCAKVVDIMLWRFLDCVDVKHEKIQYPIPMNIASSNTIYVNADYSDFSTTRKFVLDDGRLKCANFDLFPLDKNMVFFGISYDSVIDDIFSIFELFEYVFHFDECAKAIGGFIIDNFPDTYTVMFNDKFERFYTKYKTLKKI